MSRGVDLLIVGAGPAGMSAAIRARAAGLDVRVIDEQDAPGGQIWRGVEAAEGNGRARLLGTAYRAGSPVVRGFRASGAAYEPDTKLWHIEPGLRAFVSRAGVAGSVQPRAVLLATGAQERPVPFPGWTLPGVMTVGAAQILLKASGQIPAEPVWIAGCGPLPLLFAAQLLKAGGRLAGFLDTTERGRHRAAAASLSGAIAHAPADLLKGLSWLAARRRAPLIRHVIGIEALGTDCVEAVRYRTAEGREATVPARLLLVHEGLIPQIHPTLLLNCAHRWNETQACFAPVLDAWGETSHPHVFIAGDGAGIGGAEAACLRGEIAALGIAMRLGGLAQDEAERAARSLRARLARALALRPLLDALYRPRRAVLVPPDHALACRCEEISVATVREEAAAGRPGPNQVKAFTRVGMGPCQGRQCADTIAHVLADAENRAVPDVGLYRLRPPLRPVTLGELASLDAEPAA